MTKHREVKGWLVIGLVWLIGLGLIDFGFSNFGFTANSAAAMVSSPSPQPAIGHRPSGGPWIKLLDGQELATTVRGKAGLAHVLESHLAQPLALASADFDEDGVPDLVSGYAGPSGGIITLHRGNVAALWPSERVGVWASGRVGEESPIPPHAQTPTLPFLPEARVFELPEAPDFFGAGDFDADGHWDVVAAARGSEALYWLTGDGRGGLGEAQRIDLPGAVTALITGEINRRDGLDDVVVGINGSNGPQALVFEGPDGALKATPEIIALPAVATAVALGQLDESFEMDLAIAAGHELLIVHGRDRKLSLDEIRQADVTPATVDGRALPFSICSLVLGDFIQDDAHRTDLALLSDDGVVHMLEQREWANGRMGEWAKQLRVVASLPSPPLPLSPSPPLLIRANVSSRPTDDLVVLDPANSQLHILTPGDKTETTNPHSAIRIPQSAVAVLPMRLNVDALNDLVVLKQGSSAPTVMMTAAGATFTVTNTGDNGGVNPAPGAGTGTLRQAIVDANDNAGADMITFNIPGAGPHTIGPTAALPAINDPVTIDGTTQPGFIEAPEIELDGTNAGVVTGLRINAGSSVARGLAINRFGGQGITLATNGGNFIEGNRIGTDVTGTVDLGNGFTGVRIDTADNTIGGTLRSARNIISGNDGDGVAILDVGATGNQVLNNYIGTDVTGTAELGNGDDGVGIGSGPSNNTIGGTTAAARNLISGNGDNGVAFINDATGNLVQGNHIGADVTGLAALSNGGDGVEIDSATNTIGGTTAGAGNLISGNDGDGVEIRFAGSMGNQVQGNSIGADITGTADLGNSANGVDLCCSAPDNTIGGTAAGAGNTIAFNGLDGVYAEGNPAAGNAIRRNSIFSNGGLGIDLDEDGNNLTDDAVTPNDSGDGDTGPNNLQNFPVLATATSSGGATIITGSLNSAANTGFTLEFFSTPACDPSGHGEGETFIGSAATTTNSSGNVTFGVTLPVPVPAGHNITATATHSTTNDTSEFSACVGVVVPPNQPPNAVDDAATTTEDTPVIINVLTNDSDPDGGTLSVTSVTQGSNGMVVNNGNGTVTYTPNMNFSGMDTFSYTLSDGQGGMDTAIVVVTVTAVNDPPDAVNDMATTDEDTPVTITVLTNDTDPEANPLVVASVTPGSNGSVAIVNAGTKVRYTPDANFNGADSFTYTIGDGQGGTDTATVSVTVNSVNDPPMAADDGAITDEDTPVIIDVAANDSDPEDDPLTVMSVTDPPHGTVMDLGGGLLKYTPDANFTGADSFTYTVSDGQGGTDTATVAVFVNDILILQDDLNGNCLRINLNTGDYVFHTAGNGTFANRVTIEVMGMVINFQSVAGDPNLLTGGVDLFRLAGNARMLAPRTIHGVFYTINDTDIEDNDDDCP